MSAHESRGRVIVRLRKVEVGTWYRLKIQEEGSYEALDIVDIACVMGCGSGGLRE